MSYQAMVYRVMIASPSDVPEERRAAVEVIEKWNADNSFTRRVVLEPVTWESHASPAIGPPQDVINGQLLRHVDFLVAIFWSRLGTPTGGLSRNLS